MVVRIYGPSSAVSVQRVMLCLQEKEVDFELVQVNIDTMEHKRPEYLAKQPFGKVPYLEDGNLELFESRAIVRYYAAKYANRGPSLLGKTLEERAKVEQWIDVEALTYDPLVFPIVYNLVILPQQGEPSNPTIAQSCAEKLSKVLDVYENHLSKSKYLAGDEFTLADLVHIPATRRLIEDAELGYMLASRKHVWAWWEDISSRTAWKKVLDHETKLAT